MDTQTVYEFLHAGDRPVIEGVWKLETGPGEDRIAPDTRCEIIFHLAETPLENTATGWRRQPSKMIYGPLTRVLELKRTSAMRLLAIRLRPDGIGALVDNPRDLRNQSVDIRDQLTQSWIDALTPDRKSALPDFRDMALSAFATCVSDSPGAIRVAMAIGCIDDNPALRPSDMAALSGVSIRTLDRDFMRQTGLTPGEFLQITRYHAARKAIRAAKCSLSDIAAEHGYADQAHMTREFRRYAGKTPRLKRGEDPSDVFYQSG